MGEIRTATYSPDGTRILTRTSHETRLWNASDGPLVGVLYQGKEFVRGAYWSPDSRVVVTVGDDHMVRLWDGRSGAALKAFQGYERISSNASFSTDRRWLAMDAGRVVKVWQTETGMLVSTSAEHRLGVTGLAFSPGGKYIASVSVGGTARLWDPASGRTVREFPDAGELESATFSSDGRLLLSHERFGVLAKVWSVASGRAAAVLRGHTAWVASARFSPDDRFIVTAGGDGTARIWSSDHGTLMMELTGHTIPQESQAIRMTGFDAKRIGHGPGENRVFDAAFSPDGRVVVTAGADGSAQVYRCDVCGTQSDLLALGSGRVTRQLTADERARYLHQRTQ
jgi:WD40 repeat protein